MQVHQLKRNKSNRRSRVVGRGGRRGKTSGRGTKGQKARAGHKIRPAMRDIIKKLPKRRGRGTHPNKPVSSPAAVVNLEILGRSFEGGATVTPAVLLEKGLIRRVSGRIPRVKILGDGELTQALVIKDCAVSKSARVKIEKAGGKIV